MTSTSTLNQNTRWAVAGQSHEVVTAIACLWRSDFGFIIDSPDSIMFPRPIFSRPVPLQLDPLGWRGTCASASNRRNGLLLVSVIGSLLLLVTSAHAVILWTDPD